jgi:hypothetical protein
VVLDYVIQKICETVLRRQKSNESENWNMGLKGGLYNIGLAFVVEATRM